MNKKVEVLAPCGSMDILKAAINAGCDACYLGGPKFGARAYATNFNEETLLQAIDYAHSRLSKVYLTVNTLFKNQEISQLYNYIEPLYLQGLDAVIVQDFGVFDFLKENFPDLNIHCSTQMNIASVLATSYVKSLGATRVVLPREMTAKEIKEISSNVDIEIEAFVHGALCFAYSGQCLMSSLVGGRSGNRGRCAQPCRKLYDNQYKLSLKDISTITRLPEIIDAGVDSLKIEGRMKNEYYTAVTVNAYKEILEDINNNSFSIKKAKDLEFKMANIFNRGGFCQGYFFNNKPEQMLTTKRPNNQGVKIGKLTRIEGNKVFIKLCQEVNKGDVLEIILKDKSIIELTSNIDGQSNNEISLNGAKIVSIVIGQEVFRIKSKKITQDIEDTIISQTKKIDIEGEITLITGKEASFCVWLKNHKEYKVCSFDNTVDVAQKKALDKESVYNKISKLGETQFNLVSLDYQMSDNAFVPLSTLNNLRRNAIELLENKIISDRKRTVYDNIDINEDNNININHRINPEKSSKKNSIIATCINFEQFNALVNHQSIDEIYIDLFNNEALDLLSYEKCKEIWELALSNEKKILVQLPQVLRQKDIPFLENKTNILMLFDGYYVNNIDSLVFVNNKLNDGSKKIVIGSSLYNYNDYAINHFDGSNIEFELPLELNIKELNNLNISKGQLKIYGYPKVMVTAQCFTNNFQKCNSDSKGFIKIKDDLFNEFFINKYCNMCYNVIYNGKPISLHNKMGDSKESFFENINYKLDFTLESGEKTRDIVNLFVNNIINKSKSDVNYEYTTGHYYRGVE